jgi:hypothetical protein
MTHRLIACVFALALSQIYLFAQPQFSAAR